MSRIAVLKGGRSLERQVSLKSGARVEDALERLGHEVVPIDVGADLVERLTADRPDVAFVALHGRDGEDGTVQELLEVMGIPYTGSGVSACIRAADKVLAKHAMRDAGDPHPGLLRVQRDRVPGARRRAGAAGDRGAAPVPDRGQAGRPGLGARDQVRPHAGRRAGGAGGGVLLRPQGAARALRRRPRPGRVDHRRGRRAAGAADRRGGARAGGLLRLRGALRDRAHAVRLPGRARRARSPARGARSRSRSTSCSAARASPAST